MSRYDEPRWRSRYSVFLVVQGLMFVLFGVGLYRLQILEGELYQVHSQKNSIKVITEIPVRGHIYDRHGRLVVDNHPSFSLFLIPARTSAETIHRVCEFLHLDENDIRQKVLGSGSFKPFKIARHVDLTTLSFLQEHVLELPGLEWKVEPRRFYPYPVAFAHVLGILGEVGDEELKRSEEYEPGDLIGKKGIEKIYDLQLRGKKGYRFVKVDARGRTVAEIHTTRSRLPYPGKDLFLTIDARLQRYADSLMNGRAGAVVLLDVRNGEVLTLLSEPGFDLNLLSGKIDPVIWNQLLGDSLHPLYDRVCQASYPPGSTYKLVAAIAALNEKIITPGWTAFCPGYFRIGRKVIHCWNSKGHGRLDLQGAIKNSCNVYFYQLGLKIGIEVWHRYSRLFLFGRRTGIESSVENPGLVPSKAYYDRVYGKDGWTKGMLANLAIGQGELLVTPIQMAQFVMILANRGFYYQPHLTLRFQDPLTGEVQTPFYPRQRVEGVDSTVYQVVVEGMHQVVAEGTGGRARIWGIQVAGKTGTSQNPHGKPHAWFVGFAPYRSPEVAVVVLVENGGSGGAVAAPIAGKLLRRYFYYQGEFDYRAERKAIAAWLKAQKEKAIQDSLRRAQAPQEEN